MRNISPRYITVLLLFVIGSIFMFSYFIRPLSSLDPSLSYFISIISWGISAFIAFLFDKKAIILIPFIIGLVSIGILWPLFPLLALFVLRTNNDFVLLSNILLFFPSVNFAISSLIYLFLRKV